MNTRTNHGAIVPIERVEQLKPFTLPTPPPGMKWHREDGWTAEMLPPGKRPFFLGETSVKSNHDNPTDQVGGGKWAWGTLAKGEIATVDCKHLRTARPLLFIHSGHEWTWHRAGDPMPCDGEKQVCLLRTDREEFHNFSVCGNKWNWNDPTIIGWRYADAEKPDEIPWIEWHGGPCPLKDEEVEEWERQHRNGTTGNGVKPSAFNWLNRSHHTDIIAYRVLKWREKKPKVPLGPEDVPTGSVFCVKDRMPGTWHGVLGVYASTVQLDTNRNTYSFYELQQEEWLINRSIPMTGKWDANAWEACEK